MTEGGDNAKVEETKIPVERQQVADFFEKGVAMMKESAIRELLKDPAGGRPGVVLIELQQKIWDDLTVDRNHGRIAIDNLEKLYENPQELAVKRAEFVSTAKATYMKALQDRRPGVLEKEAKLSRESVFEFFDACNLLVESKELREELVKDIAESGDFPNKTLNGARASVMQLLGYDVEHGLKCFADLGDSFPDDKEMAGAYESWQKKAHGLCLQLVYEYKKGGGEIKGGVGLVLKILEIQAHHELDAMSREDCSALLDKNAKRVQTFRSLPPEGRERYLEKLPEAEKLELMKSEILLMAVMQNQKQQAMLEARRQQLAAQTVKADGPAEDC